MGTRLIASTPPPMTTSMAPDITAWAAKWTACWAEPHCRSTVVPGHGVGEAGGQGGVAPDVHGLLAHGHGAAVDHVLDQGRVEVVALDQRPEGLGGQVDGVPSGEPAVLLPHRGADDIDDHGVGHAPIVAERPWLPEIWRCVRFPVPTRTRPSRPPNRWNPTMDTPMDLRFTPAQEAFRAEARAWLAAHVPGAPVPPLPGHRRGVRGPPGLGADHVRRPLVGGVVARGVRRPGRGHPRVADLRGGVLAGPGPPAGEPERGVPAGADPVRVRDRGAAGAVPAGHGLGRARSGARDGPSPTPAATWPASAAGRCGPADDGGWLLTGQKTWASRGAFAEWCFGLFRTDPEAERHRGLTYFLIDMATPGVTVRPIPQIDGETGFAELFFEDVFVPDAQVLGRGGPGLERGHGHRRVRAGPEPAQPGPLHRGGRPAGRALRRAAGRRPGAGRPERRRRGPGLDGRRGLPAQHAVDGHPGARRRLGRARGQRQQDPLVGDRPGHPPGRPRPCSGPEAELHGDGIDAPWLDGYLFALAGPIYAGTNEIQRNVVAERMLGLPRG